MKNTQPDTTTDEAFLVRCVNLSPGDTFTARNATTGRDWKVAHDGFDLVATLVSATLEGSKSEVTVAAGSAVDLLFLISRVRISESADAPEPTQVLADAIKSAMYHLDSGRGPENGHVYASLARALKDAGYND